MTTRPDLDRPEPRLVKAERQGHVDVDQPRRGALNQSRDAAQHRRYTALYDDLQN